MKYQDNDFDESDEMLFKYFKENKENPDDYQFITGYGYITND